MITVNDILVPTDFGEAADAALTYGRELAGSVAERVVRLASCPVLTVRHPEHEFVRPDTLVAAARTQESIQQ
jgi:hypothetical protein